MDTAAPRKRNHTDLLASLDAAFAGNNDNRSDRSSYTSKAAVAQSNAAAQQAYLHSKKKKKKRKTTPTTVGSSATVHAATKPASNKGTGDTHKKTSDPLYSSLDEKSVLITALKDCSLRAGLSQRTPSSGRKDILRQYIDSFFSTARGPDAGDKLKNKVLQLDNPVKARDSSKSGANGSTSMYCNTAALMNARQRREFHLHLVGRDMKYDDALMLNEIWKRYAKDVIGDTSSLSTWSREQMNRLQLKLRGMDMSGCVVEVVRAVNPTHVGLQGVIVNEREHIIQICLPKDRVITLRKDQVVLRVELDGCHRLIIDATWLAGRSWLSTKK